MLEYSLHLPDLVPHVLDQIEGGTGEAEHAAHDRDGLEDLVDRSLIGAEHGHACADQLRAHLGLQVGKREDQVRLEAEDAVDAEAREPADLGLVPGLRRTAAVPGTPTTRSPAPSA